MKEKAVELLRELTNAHAVSGHEDEVRGIFAHELKGIGEFTTDKNGSIACERGLSGPKVLFAGHMDEVGFLVQHITPDGFIKFLPVGGWWTHNLLAQKVVVKTQDGNKVEGVISSKPPHFLPDRPLSILQFADNRVSYI